jgi:hypothetical protein
MSTRPTIQSQSAPQGANDRATRHKPILAERFKNKMCRTFIETGSCPYEERCMFAHGDADLRTKEMNLADKLTTEEAIRSFQRATRERNMAAAASTSTDSKSKASLMHVMAAAKMTPVELDPLQLASPTSEDTPVATATAPPTPEASSAVKGLRFLNALCSPAAGPASTTDLTPCAADERPTSPVSGAGSCLPTHPCANGGSALDLSLSGHSDDDFVAKDARAFVDPAAVVCRPAGPKRYRHDPYAPVVFGAPQHGGYFAAYGPLYDNVTVATLPTPFVKVVVGSVAPVTPPQKPLQAPSTVPMMSTYGPKMASYAVIASGCHEVLLA